MNIINIEEIKSLLKHRYPFLLVDKIISFEKNTQIKGVKNITYNEPHFQGHFPGMSVMPGVLIIEAMAQIAGILAIKSIETTPQHTYLTHVDKAKFKRTVVPGDILEITAVLEKRTNMLIKFKAFASVEDKIVSEAVLTLYSS